MMALWNRLTKGSFFLPPGRGQKQMKKINYLLRANRQYTWYHPAPTDIVLISNIELVPVDSCILCTTYRFPNFTNIYLTFLTFIEKQPSIAVFLHRNQIF